MTKIIKLLLLAAVAALAVYGCDKPPAPGPVADVAAVVPNAPAAAPAAPTSASKSDAALAESINVTVSKAKVNGPVARAKHHHGMSKTERAAYAKAYANAARANQLLGEHRYLVVAVD